MKNNRLKNFVQKNITVSQFIKALDDLKIFKQDSRKQITQSLRNSQFIKSLYSGSNYFQQFINTLYQLVTIVNKQAFQIITPEKQILYYIYKGRIEVVLINEKKKKNIEIIVNEAGIIGQEFYKVKGKNARLLTLKQSVILTMPWYKIKNHLQIFRKKQANQIMMFFKTNFQQFSKEIMNYRVLELIKKQTYEHCEYIYKKGDKANFIYFLLQGQIYLSQEDNSNKKIYGLLIPPNIFGEQQIIFNLEKRIYNVKCKSKQCVILKLSLENIIKKKQNPNFFNLLQETLNLKHQYFNQINEKFQKITKIQSSKQKAKKQQSSQNKMYLKELTKMAKEFNRVGLGIKQILKEKRKKLKSQGVYRCKLDFSLQRNKMYKNKLLKARQEIQGRKTQYKNYISQQKYNTNKIFYQNIKYLSTKLDEQQLQDSSEQNKICNQFVTKLGMKTKLHQKRSHEHKIKVYIPIIPHYNNKYKLKKGFLKKIQLNALNKTPLFDAFI